MTNHTPSKKKLQAIEDSTVLFFDKAKLTGLYGKSDFYQKLGRMILEKLTIIEQKYSAFLTPYGINTRSI